MNTLRSVLVWLCFMHLSLVSLRAELLPYDPVKMRYPVSPVQAEQVVRSWADDPQLAVILKGVQVYDFGQWYVFETDDGQYLYEVDCYSGEMRHWRDIAMDKLHFSKPDDDGGSLPNETLNAAIGEFLERKYWGFSSLNMQHFNPDEPGSVWMQRLPNGAWYRSNRVWCGVDNQTGQVYLYRGYHGPPPAISIVPAVPAIVAEQIAIDYAGTILVDYYDETSEENRLVSPLSAFVLKNWGLFLTCDVLGLQRLYWDVEVVLNAGPGYTAVDYYQELEEPIGVPSGVEYAMFVDAHTGQVFYYEASGMIGAGGTGKLKKAEMAKSKSRKPNPAALKGQSNFEKAKLSVNGVEMAKPSYPPITVLGVPYIYVGYLSALTGGQKHWVSGTVTLTMPGTIARLKANSVQLQVNERTHRLKQPTRIVADRMYVPYSSVKLICGTPAVWDATKKVLRITAPVSSRKAPSPR